MIEIKSINVPQDILKLISEIEEFKGFYSALEVLKPDRSFVVYGGKDSYPLSKSIEAVSLPHIMKRVQERGSL